MVMKEVSIQSRELVFVGILGDRSAYNILTEGINIGHWQGPAQKKIKSADREEKIFTSTVYNLIYKYILSIN